MNAFITVEQCKRIISKYLHHSGRGGFMTGTILSVEPLTIRVEDRLTVTEEDLYITENCIGLIMHFKHDHKGKVPPDLKNDVVVFRPFEPGEGVLLLCRPGHADKGEKYILLDRIQPYQVKREVDTRFRKSGKQNWNLKSPAPKPGGWIWKITGLQNP